MSFTSSRLNLLQLFNHDEVSRALQVIEEEHFLIHKGSCWLVFGSELDVPDGASRFWIFRTGERAVHFKRLTLGASEGPVVVSLYEEPTRAPGGPGIPSQNIRNLNRFQRNKLPKLQIFNTTPVPVDNGVEILGSLYIPQQGNQGVTGRTGAIEEYVLLPNTEYLFELVNDPAGAGTADIYVSIVFYEIDYDDELGDPLPPGSVPWDETPTAEDFQLSVGNNLGVYGFSTTVGGGIGSIAPTSFEGLDIVDLIATTPGDVVDLGFAGSAQIPGVTEIAIKAGAAPELTLVWNGALYTAVDAAVATEIVEAETGVMPLSLRVVNTT